MNESSEEEQMNHLRPLIQELGQIFARAWQDDADAIGVIMDKLREEGFGVLFEVNVGLVRQEDLSAVEPKPVPQRRRRRLVKESGEIHPEAYNHADDQFLKAVKIAPIATPADPKAKFNR